MVENQPFYPCWDMAVKMMTRVMMMRMMMRMVVITRMVMRMMTMMIMVITRMVGMMMNDSGDDGDDSSLSTCLGFMWFRISRSTHAGI